MLRAHHALRLAVVALFLLTPALSEAQVDARKLRLGDKIEVDFGGWKSAKVLEIRRNGWIRVQVDNSILSPTLPPDRFRLPPKPTAKPSKPPAGDDSFNPATLVTGDKVEVFFLNSWKPATVLEVRTTGSVVVEVTNTKHKPTIAPSRVRLPADVRAKLAAEKKAAAAKTETPAVEKPTEPEAAPNEDGLVTLQTDGADQLIWNGAPTTVGVKPDPRPAVKAPLRGIKTSTAGRGFPTDKRLFLAAGSEPLAMISESRRRSAGRLEVLSLSGGSSRSLDLGNEQSAIDVSPDGSRILLQANGFSFGTKDQLTLLSRKGSTLSPLVSFKPHGDQSQFKRDVQFARMIDDQHVLVHGSNYTVTLWKLPEARLVYVADVGMHAAVGTSPGGKQLVVCNNHGVNLYETLTGKPLTKLSDDSALLTQMSFSPDGRLLAVGKSGRMRVFELETGQTRCDFPVVSFRGDIVWTTESHLLLGGEFLIDLNRRITLWHYKPAAAAVVSTEFGCWYLAPGEFGQRELTLRGGQLPHPAALQLSSTLRPETVLDVLPGVQVALTVSVGSLNAEEIRKGLEAKVTANGATVVPNSPLRLVATTSPGPSKEISYRTFGTREISKLNAPTHKVRIAYERDGKTLWETGFTTHTPTMLSVKEGQTIQQALAEASKPSDHFFKNAWIPKYVARPAPTGMAYGSSPLP